MAGKPPSEASDPKNSDSEEDPDFGSDFDPDELSDVGDDDDIFNEMDDAQSELEALHLEELSSVKSKLYTMETRMKDINRELVQIKDCISDKAHEEEHPTGAAGDSYEGNEDDDDEDDNDEEEDPITQVSRLTEELQNFTNQMRADKNDLDHRLDRIEESLKKMITGRA